ncbi:Uncharacterised protein [Raoultella planticola]|uniref:Alkanesulfonates-binding protein n=1 Tax=Raoultella planticola TaxID=575 RepID=A0A485B5C0_RAOPL|nr:Uncharacterised protein [Raoultella planticola]
MMKAIFTRTALALVAVVTLMASAQAESLRTIRIGVPDQSAGSKPFIEGPVGMAFIRHQLEAVFKPQGVEVQWQFFKGAGPAVNEALANRQLDFVYLGDLRRLSAKPTVCQPVCCWQPRVGVLPSRSPEHRRLNSWQI